MSDDATTTPPPQGFTARRHTFPRSRRLSGKLAFAAVYDVKAKESRGPLLVFSRVNGLGHSRRGLSVSRRVGNAVRRNRVKRLLREAFRGQQHDLPTGYDFVIVVRPHGPMILAEYQRLWTSLTLRAHHGWRAAAGHATDDGRPAVRQ